MGLFSTAKKEVQIGVDFLSDGVAVAQVQTGKKNRGAIICSEFVAASGTPAQVQVSSGYTITTCIKRPVFAWLRTMIAIFTRLRDPKSMIPR